MYANAKSTAHAGVTVPQLHAMKAKGEKIVMLTAYDASFAAQCDAAGVDAVLVGDSLGMVVQGRDSTLPVSVDDMVYHTAAVARGTASALLIADMPFMSFRDADTALRSAGRLLTEGGAAITEGYDALIISTGVSNGFWRQPTMQSAAEIGAGLRSAHDRLAAAASVVVVGGGAAAVSSALNMATTWPDKRIDLYFPGGSALEGHHPRIWRRIRGRLTKLGVGVHPGHRAKPHASASGRW